MKLALVGLTLANQSLALALRPVIKEIEIIGHDPDSERVKAARRAKVIDKSHWNLLAACEGAHLILLDVPADEARTNLAALRDEIDQETVIVDHAGLMAPRMALLDDLAWPHGNLVSAHLLLKDYESQEPADHLTWEATYFLAARADTTPRALDTATNLAQAAGALPRFVGAAEHDGLMAATAQMPRLAALLVMHALTEPSGARERLAARGSELVALEDLLEAGSAASQAEGLLSNSAQALHWLDAYGQALVALRALIAAGDAEPLTAWLDQARQDVDAWLASAEPERPEVTSGSQMRSIFLGSLGRRRKE